MKDHDQRNFPNRLFLSQNPLLSYLWNHLGGTSSDLALKDINKGATLDLFFHHHSKSGDEGKKSLQYFHN